MVSVKSLLIAGSALLAAISASPISSPATVDRAIVERQEDPLCGYGEQGIVKPKANTTMKQTEDGVTFEVVYCSGQYFKTSTLDATIWLHTDDTVEDGELLTRPQGPDDIYAAPGYSSYSWNVTVLPNDGDYYEGDRWLGVYETATGYYNAYNYFITQIPLHFIAPPS